MTSQSSPEFYTRREQQSLAAADRAASPELRSIHLRMAKEYAERARRDPEQAQTFRLVGP